MIALKNFCKINPPNFNPLLPANARLCRIIESPLKLTRPADNEIVIGVVENFEISFIPRVISSNPWQKGWARF